MRRRDPRWGPFYFQLVNSTGANLGKAHGFLAVLEMLLSCQILFHHTNLGCTIYRGSTYPSSPRIPQILQRIVGKIAFTQAKKYVQNSSGGKPQDTNSRNLHLLLQPLRHTCNRAFFILWPFLLGRLFLCFFRLRTVTCMPLQTVQTSVVFGIRGECGIEAVCIIASRSDLERSAINRTDRYRIKLQTNVSVTYVSNNHRQ